MFAGMRSKKKNRDSPGAAGSACAKTDQQQQQQHSKRKDVVPEALKLPSPLKYYPGTQMPMDGWFHACRLCRCWTAFSATATTGEVVPLCRRCLPSAAHKGQTAPKVASQQHLSSSNSSAATAAAAATNGPSKASQPAAALHKSSNKSTDTPTKVNHPWGSSYANLHQQQQQYHQAQTQQQQQQQRVQQRPQPGQAKSTTVYKAGSRVFKSASNEPGSYVAPSQAAAAAAAATAAMAHAAAPAPVPSAPPMPHPQQSYRRTSSSNSVPDRRSSTGDGQYVSAACYKHLGPSNMHSAAAAPADAYITCLGSGSTDNGSSSGGREQNASDMLGAITSLLSDLYNMRFSGSSGSASSSNGCSAGEVDSRSNSMSKKQAAAAAAAAAAAENLRNLPI